MVLKGTVMRLRKVQGAQEKIDSYPQIVIPNPKDYKGKWKAFFGNDNPLHIEIGMGKGGFIKGMAEQNPNVNYIGIELFESVLVRALEKFIETPMNNVKLLKVNAAYLLDYFDKDEIDRIYLNFSDPWPKKKHAKRRLTHSNFLKLYQEILHPDGDLCFKSDNRLLFEFSLISFNEFGLKFEELSLDLHANEPEDNVRTEYETTWSAKGSKIYRIVVTFP